jgi:hypothetical protein
MSTRDVAEASNLQEIIKLLESLKEAAGTRGSVPACSSPAAALRADLLKAVSQWSLKRLASGRYIARVVPASIIEATVPGASPSPAAPGEVIAEQALWSMLPDPSRQAPAAVH